MRPDYPKIVFVGIPLLLMLWGIVLVLLIVITHNPFISKYGAFAFFIFSIPIYGYLATRHAVALHAVIDDDTDKGIEHSEAKSSLNKNISSRDLWVVSIGLVLWFSGILLAQLKFGVKNREVIESFRIAIPIVVLVEIIARKIAQKRRRQRDTESPNQAL